MTLTGSKSSTLVPNGTEDYPFLIELTAKRWKGLILLAFLLGFVGMFLFFWQAWTIVYSRLFPLKQPHSSLHQFHWRTWLPTVRSGCCNWILC